MKLFILFIALSFSSLTLAHDSILKGKSNHTLLEEQKLLAQRSRAGMELLANKKRLAEQGDVDAQVNLGNMFDLGHLYSGIDKVPEDHTQSAYWFHKAANQGNPHAQFNLGLMYLYGRGIPHNDKLAYYWLNQAAKKNSREAKRILKYTDFGIANRVSNFEITQELTKQDYLMAQIKLGHYYQNKIYVASYSYSYWFEQALKEDADAQYHLGNMYYKGEDGTPQNYRKAFHWFQQAAMQGHAEALFKLGEMHEFEIGVPKSLIYSYAYFSIAATYGLEKAKRNLNNFSHSSMSSEEISEAQKLSVDIFNQIEQNLASE